MRLTDLLELAARKGMQRYVEKRAGVLLPLAVGAQIPGIVHRAVERAHKTEEALDRAAYDPMKVATVSDRGPFSVGDTPGRTPSFTMDAPMSLTRSNPFTRGTAFGRAGGKALGGQMGGDLLKSLGGLGTSPITGAAGGISGGISELIKRKLLGREIGEKKDPFSLAGAGAASSFGKEMGTTGANLLRDIANKAMEAAGHAGDASARQAIIGDLKRTDSVLASADDATLMEAYHTMTRFAPVLSTDKNAVRSFLRQAVMSGSGPDYMSIKLLADSERAVTGDKER